MNKKNWLVLIIVLILVLALVVFLVMRRLNKEPIIEEPIIEEPFEKISAIFLCDNEKFILAEFSQKEVLLNLSDGRVMTLPQAISASGARYANEDESFVFWNKGDTAFIDEGGVFTFENCLSSTDF